MKTFELLTYDYLLKTLPYNLNLQPINNGIRTQVLKNSYGETLAIVFVPYKPDFNGVDVVLKGFAVRNLLVVNRKAYREFESYLLLHTKRVNTVEYNHERMRTIHTVNLLSKDDCVRKTMMQDYDNNYFERFNHEGS